MRGEEYEQLKAAFDQLATLIEHETVQFEVSALGKPFLPRDESTNTRTLTNHCRRLDSVIGDGALNHLIWMAKNESAHSEDFVEYILWKHDERIRLVTDLTYQPGELLERVVGTAFLKSLYYPEPQTVGSPLRLGMDTGAMLIAYVVSADNEMSEFVKSRHQDQNFTVLLAEQERTR